MNFFTYIITGIVIFVGVCFGELVTVPFGQFMHSFLIIENIQMLCGSWCANSL